MKTRARIAALCLTLALELTIWTADVLAQPIGSGAPIAGGHEKSPFSDQRYGIALQVTDRFVHTFDPIIALTIRAVRAEARKEARQERLSEADRQLIARMRQALRTNKQRVSEQQAGLLAPRLSLEDWQSVAAFFGSGAGLRYTLVAREILERQTAAVRISVARAAQGASGGKSSAARPQPPEIDQDRLAAAKAFVAVERRLHRELLASLLEVEADLVDVRLPADREARIDRLMRRTERIHARLLSREDLDQLTTFYAAGVGKRYSDALAAVGEELSAWLPKWIEEATRDIAR